MNGIYLTPVIFTALAIISTWKLLTSFPALIPQMLGSEAGAWPPKFLPGERKRHARILYVEDAAEAIVLAAEK